jgi:hypothetical protein
MFLLSPLQVCPMCPMLAKARIKPLPSPSTRKKNALVDSYSIVLMTTRLVYKH